MRTMNRQIVMLQYSIDESHHPKIVSNSHRNCFKYFNYSDKMASYINQIEKVESEKNKLRNTERAREIHIFIFNIALWGEREST